MEKDGLQVENLKKQVQNILAREIIIKASASSYYRVEIRKLQAQT